MKEREYKPKPCRAIINEALKYHLLTILLIAGRHLLPHLPELSPALRAVMHLAIASHKDDFVFRVLRGRRGILQALLLQHELLLVPLLDEMSDVFFQILKHATCRTRMFQPQTELLGDLVLVISSRPLTLTAFLVCVVSVPERREVVRNIFTTGVSWLDKPVARRGWLGPWIVQQTVLRRWVSTFTLMKRIPCGIWN